MVTSKKSADWIEFFELRGNPFSTTPLRDESDFKHLFVETLDILQKILPLCKYISSSAPSLRIFSGSRGVGKSTCLSYMRKLLRANENVLTVIVGEQKVSDTFVDDARYGIGSPLAWYMIKELIHGIKTRFPDAYERNQAVLNQISEYLAISDFAPTKYPTWIECRNAMEKLLEVLSREGKFSFIAIDNYDKLQGDYQDLAVEFLRGNNAQPFFEDLQRAGATIVLALDNRTLKKLRDPDFSYLGDPIEIGSLNLEEGIELLRRRLACWASVDSLTIETIFEEKAIQSLLREAKGVPREIIKLAEHCLEDAFTRQIQPVNETIVRDVVETLSEEYEEFYEIMRTSPRVERGYDRLSSFFTSLSSTTETQEALEAIENIFHNREVAQDTMLERLRQFQIASLIDAPRGKEIVLRIDIKLLMDEMEKRKLLIRFLRWLSKKGAGHGVAPRPEQLATIPRLEDLAQEIEIERAKKGLLSAQRAFEEITRIMRRDDYDTNTVTELSWEAYTGIWKTAYLLERWANKLMVPNEDLLRAVEENISTKYPGAFLALHNLKTANQMRAWADVPKNYTETNLAMVHNEIPQALNLIQEANSKLATERDRPEILQDLDEDAIGRRIAVILKNADFLLITSENFTFDEFCVVLWDTPNPQTEAIYGFGSGNAFDKLGQLFETYEFRSKKLFVPTPIKAQLITLAIDVSSPRLSLQFFNARELSSALCRHLKQFSGGYLNIDPVGPSTECKREFEMWSRGRSYLFRIFSGKKRNLPPEFYVGIEKELEQTISAPEKKKIAIVDGNNVAWSSKDEYSKPKLKNIILVRDSLLEREFEVAVLVSAKLKYDIDRPSEIRRMIKQHDIEEAPARSYDDTFIIKAAEQHKGYVVSNDQFKDFEDATWLQSRQLRYKIILGKVIFESI